MTTRTRYFVIASLLVLSVGVGTGLVAYYVGFPDGVAVQARAEDLRLLPRDAQLVAYANVRQVMASEMRQKLRTLVPLSGQGQRDLADQTGINIDTDIEEVLSCLAPSQGTDGQSLPLALARGRFDVGRLENLMESKGGRAEMYKGAKVIILSPPDADRRPLPQSDRNPALQPPSPSDSFAVSFIEPELAALGSVTLVRLALDQRAAGPGVTGNSDLMALIRSIDGSDLWAVGDFEAIASKTNLPMDLGAHMPGITKFAAAADVDAGIHGSVRADTRDQASADDLRQVIQGLLALGRLQLRSQPDLKPFLDSLVLGGSGNSVSLAFDVPPQMIDLLGLATGRRGSGPNAAPLAR